MNGFRAVVVAFLLLPGFVVRPMSFAPQFPDPSEHPAIAYTLSEPADPVARLRRRIASGEVALRFEPGEHGYLRSVLSHLGIPVSSQTLAFSKTSLQVDRIGPRTPRALFFSDDVYVAWVPGGRVIEFASLDPKLGAVFYVLDQMPDGPPSFTRQTSDCLVCHSSNSSTGGVPGFLIRSVLPDQSGYVADTFVDAVNDQTPFSQRWGGWYVTGTHGPMRHLGNLIAGVSAGGVGNSSEYIARRNLDDTANRKDLIGRFNAPAYLSPHSDIVALLLIAHQTHVHNLAIQVSHEVRRSLHTEGLGERVLGGREIEHLNSTLDAVRKTVEPLVKAMLFVNEAPIASRIAGTSGFASEFAAAGKRDSKGRSLRDLALEQRLFRYPLSHLIYSESVQGLPDVARRHLYVRLDDVLSGRDRSPAFDHLSNEDRRAVLEILRETLPDFRRLLGR